MEDKCEADILSGSRPEPSVTADMLSSNPGGAGCWSTGVLEFCALSELEPANVGLEVLSGRCFLGPIPVVKTPG
jgi:hypothetical protein